MSKRISPLPEAIDGRHWIVKEGTGSCDTLNRILRVPTDDSPGSRFVRNHEVAHAKLTPRVPAFKQCKKFGVSMEGIQVCEDLRLHLFLRRCGIEMCGHLTDDEAERFVRREVHSDRSLVALLVSCLHTADYDRIMAALKRHVEEPRRRDLVHTVSLIEARMSRARGLERPIGLRNGTVPAARLFDAVLPEDGAPASQLPIHRLFCPNRGRATKWGEMTTVRLDAEQCRPIPAVARGRSFCDHGAVLAAPYRLPVDGRVFRRPRRLRGGTVLIDASSSMCFGPADLERITAAAPLATVAVYTGEGRSGTLTIVASRGRMARASAIDAASGRGNVVDGPALRWLARQPEPRIWISDGKVTGINDRRSTDLVVDAIGICRQAGIRRTSTADGVGALL